LIADNSLSGRTIGLLSPLPALTSNLVINGISQTGAAIGVSDAKIMLFHGAGPDSFKFLYAEDCTDAGIYGSAMINIANNANDTIEGISYLRCYNLRIGQPGAGILYLWMHACHPLQYGQVRFRRVFFL
jgi:hypothetical protein